MLTQEQFIRNFSVMADGEVDFFIGAGASIASGIPTGGDLIWEFKRNIYCSECGISVEKYKDVALPSTRAMLQKYFDQKGTCPIQYAPEEYSFYFEQCYNNPLARKRFIEMLVSKHEPSLGYLCMAEAIVKGKVKNVWTTNFDSLLERAIHTLYPLSSILIFSEANKNSIDTFNPAFPVIGKLHGDYRYDWLRNTEQELQQLEVRIKSCVSNQLQNKQLVVIGYSGNDESIMSLFESNMKKRQTDWHLFQPVCRFLLYPIFLSKKLLVLLPQHLLSCCFLSGSSIVEGKVFRLMPGLGIFEHYTVRIKGIAGHHSQAVITVHKDQFPVLGRGLFYRNFSLTGDNLYL